MARCRLRRILGGEAWGGGGENEDVGIIWLNLVNIGNAWEVLDKRCWWAYIDISSSGERHCDVGSKTSDYRLFSIAQHHLTPCFVFSSAERGLRAASPNPWTPCEKSCAPRLPEHHWGGWVFQCSPLAFFGRVSE